jgi:hypothetical protein
MVLIAQELAEGIEARLLRWEPDLRDKVEGDGDDE